MKAIILFVIGVISISHSTLFGQQFYEKIYLEDRTSLVRDHIISPDSNIYIGGSSRSSSAQFTDIMTAKIDSSGELSWIRENGSPGFDYGYRIVLSGNHLYTLGKRVVGGIVIQGDLPLDITDFYITKHNVEGDLIWEQTYDLSQFDQGIDILMYEDTLFVAGIMSNYVEMPFFQGTKENVVVLKIDTLGQALDTISFPQTNPYDEISNVSMIRLPDSQFVLSSLENGTSTLRKFSSQGNLIWSHENPNIYNRLISTEDGGFTVLGTKVEAWSTNKIYLAKFTQHGNIEWQRSYEFALNYALNNLSQFPDSGYIFSGKNNNRAFLFRCNAIGDSIWYREFGRGLSSSLYKVSVSDNMIIASGTIFQNNSTSALLVKTSPDGLIDTSFVITSLLHQDIDTESLRIFPNPASTKLTFQYKGPGQLRLIEVFSSTGKLIFSQKAQNQGQIDLSQLNQKLVFLRFSTQNERSIIRKVQIE